MTAPRDPPDPAGPRPGSPDLAAELRTLVTYGGPIVFAQFGFLLFSLVDTFMVGRLPAGAVGGVGAANSVYWFLAMALSGVFYALDPLTAQARGRGEPAEARRLLLQALGLAAALSAGFVAVLTPLAADFSVLGTAPEVLRYAAPYFAIVYLSGPMFFFFVVVQRYSQAEGKTGGVLAIVFAANAVNALANEALIFGRWGAPALGIRGAAYATLAARGTLMLLGLAWLARRLLAEAPAATLLREARPAPAAYRRILGIGLPVAAGMAMEYGLFSLATQMATRLDAAAADAHQIGIVVISTTYMLPVGLANTAAFRVGHLVGAGDPAAARRVGGVYLGAAVAAMAAMTVALLAGSDAVLRAFGAGPETAATGRVIFRWLVALMVFDAVQVVAGGCLRGFGETKIPARAAAIGYYLVGLPVAWGLCFPGGYGAPGLWAGLAAGLVAVAAQVGAAWYSFPLPPSPTDPETEPPR